MLKIQTGFHPALRAGEEDMVSKDLLGVSPDIKKFASQKRNMLAYMQQVKDNEDFTLEPQMISPFGEDFDDNASAAGLTNYSYHRGITKISHLLEGVSQNERRTLLRTREVDDNIPDYLKMEVAKFKKLSPQEVADAYKQIKKATKTVFSGTVDPLVNLLDYGRVKSKLSRNALCNQNEIDIIEELVRLRKSLDARALMMGMWDTIDTVGSTPDSREGASACLMGDKIFVFGGFSRLLFKDIRYIDTSDFRWKMIDPVQSSADPPGRYNHSMCQFASRYLIIFGGAGHYMKSMGVRQCMNDLFILDTQKSKWTMVEQEKYTPGIRMNHVAASLGSLMLVQGGYNSETKKTYRDIHLFDIQTQQWIRTIVAKEGDYQRNQTLSQIDYDIPQNTNSSSICEIPARHMHTMQVVRGWEDGAHPKTRIDWVKPSGKRVGFYMFGGKNHLGNMVNELWFIKPLLDQNQKLLSKTKFDYVSHRPALFVTIEQVTEFSGRPPCPRIHAASCMIKNLFDDPLLVIYGGRNDAIFAGTRNVALNDVCLFNTVSSEWMSLAMYGIQPCSRWSHVIVPNRECNPTGFLVLGGVNLNNYCRSKLYSFHMLSFGKTPNR